MENKQSNLLPNITMILQEQQNESEQETTKSNHSMNKPNVDNLNIYLNEEKYNHEGLTEDTSTKIILGIYIKISDN